MRLKDLHLLPKFRDGWSSLYLEQCRIDRDAQSVSMHDERGSVHIPCANLAVLMLGPGVSITHAAITTLAENGCLVMWCGEQGVRFYATGSGETRSARNLLLQAQRWADPESHLAVVRRMYSMRFSEPLSAQLTLQQIRGMEGIRVRETYARWSRETGVSWSGRSYARTAWASSDPINRALSAANSCLYGITHAAIVSAGFSPALGFIHTGKMLSFVYDVADLYKTEVTIPIAFHSVAEGEEQLERRVRCSIRDMIAQEHLLQRMIHDLFSVFEVAEDMSEDLYAADEAKPGSLWDPDDPGIAGGTNYSPEEQP